MFLLITETSLKVNYILIAVGYKLCLCNSPWNESFPVPYQQTVVKIQCVFPTFPFDIPHSFLLKSKTSKRLRQPLVIVDLKIDSI